MLGILWTQVLQQAMYLDRYVLWQGNELKHTILAFSHVPLLYTNAYRLG